MKTKVATQHDINNVLELAYQVNKEVGREYIDKALMDHCFYVVHDEDKIVGAIVYSNFKDDVTIMLFLVKSGQLDVARRLLYTIEASEPASISMLVPEEDLDTQLIFRGLGIKCTGLMPITASKNVYQFHKQIKKKGSMDAVTGD